MIKIPFNKPYLSGGELAYIEEAIKSGRISGNGRFTSQCHSFFEKKYGFGKCLLTSSCTDALEMAAILLDIREGDEVIMPSYTFVSTANAFVLRGASIVFADCRGDHPNMDANEIEKLITKRTKAIVPVHYAGLVCDMDSILSIASKHGLYVIEDAAQAIDSLYKDRPAGTFGHLSAFSFHETKNIISGEGGMLVINSDEFRARAEVIWEKGTNRSSFFRGEVNKYEWIDMGSSFLPSDMVAAFLFAQLECLDQIQLKRKEIWDRYDFGLRIGVERGFFRTMLIDNYCSNNYHMYYLVCNSLDERTELLKFLKESGIGAIFHYQVLHKSPFFSKKYNGKELKNAELFADCLIRLPLFFELSVEDQKYVIDKVLFFFTEGSSIKSS